MKYERMLPHEIDKVVGERPIAVVPLGCAGVAWSPSGGWSGRTEGIRYRSDLSSADQGVGGEDPSTASSWELGERIVNAIVERVSDRALQLLRQAEEEKLIYEPWPAEGVRKSAEPSAMMSPTRS